MNSKTTHLASYPLTTSLMRFVTLALAAFCLLVPPASDAESSIDELLFPSDESSQSISEQLPGNDSRPSSSGQRPRTHSSHSYHSSRGKGFLEFSGGGLDAFFRAGCDPRIFAVFAGAAASFCAYELLVPFDWMRNGTVSDYLNQSPSTSTEGDGSIWPLGFGFLLDSQFPGEAANVAFADIGVLSIRHANVYGVQACGLKAAVTDDCAGLSVGGLFAAAENVYGIQVGGLLSSCRSDIYGIQVAGYANDTPGICTGMQAGIVNMAGNVYGMQAGFTNSAKEVSGMQIGVVNVAQNMRGVQIGLVNIIKDSGVLPVSMLFNARF